MYKTIIDQKVYKLVYFNDQNKITERNVSLDELSELSKALFNDGHGILISITLNIG